MLNKLKQILKNIEILRPGIIFWQRGRLVLFSYFNLPPEVKTPLNQTGEYVVFKTRDWATAGFCKNNTKGNVLNYEPNQRKIFDFVVSRSEVVFDVGTQIGYYAIVAARLGARRVIAFDIDRSLLEIAKKHAVTNGVSDRIEFVRGAVGSDAQNIEVLSFGATVSGKGFSLDSFCSDRGIWPNFLKMDIEGFELEALEGSPRLLSRRPIIMLGLHPEFIVQRSKSAYRVFEILFDNDYEIISLGPIGLGERVRKEDKGNGFLSGKAIDFICVPKNNKLISGILARVSEIIP